MPNRWQPQFDRYHYRFAKGSTIVHVIWKIGAPETVQVPVSRPNVSVLTIGGKTVSAPRQVPVSIGPAVAVTPDVRDLADAIPHRQTNRRPFGSTPIPPRILEKLTAATRAEAASLVVLQNR